MSDNQIKAIAIGSALRTSFGTTAGVIVQALINPFILKKNDK